MKKFFAEFKKFALRGNVLDMAVGIIIGGAFTAIVTALTTNLIQPFLNAVLAWDWDLFNRDVIAAASAAFLTAVITFILTAFILFLLIKSINGMMSVGKKPAAPAAPTTKKCPYCKSDIAIEAIRCPHCTSELKDGE